MVHKEHIIRGTPQTPEPFFVEGTVKYPTHVPYYIQRGTRVVNQGPVFYGAYLTVLGNEEGKELRAELIDISGDNGNFTSLEEAEVRTTKGAEVPKLRGWNFLAPLSSAIVMPQC